MSIFLVSCEGLRTAAFDQYSYQKATEIKVEAANLLDSAVYPYAEHEQKVEKLREDLQKIIEYEKNKSYNDISLAMWQILSDEEKNLLAGLLKRWENQQQLSPAFVQESKAQVMEAINLIIKYEAAKDKTSKAQLQKLINTY
ncbi:hypothetical protein RBU60_01915 [Mesonia sp. MT50]|uniref:Uncharacterized protein n=1 Tax=Mesonia profundi TaxID=3070998 RepID=A0ABU1A0S7_9FLAO|nr:hypothetical protein [Mesonia profundi]MDQ7916316.1 hypothetical protein [Mesonia profundi]